MRHVDLFSGIAGFAYAAKQVWGDKYENVLFCENNRFCQEIIKKNFGKDSVIYGDIKELTKERFIADTNERRLQKQRTEQQAGRDRQFSEVTADTDRTRGGTSAGRIDKDRSQKNEGWTKQPQPELSGSDSIDLITAGFPCQPFSQAGKRRGKDDDRYLWPQALRVIKEFEPKWVVIENVAGLFGILEPDSISEVERKEVEFFHENNNKNSTTERIYRRIIGTIITDFEQIGYDFPRTIDGTPIIFCVPACAVNAPHRRDRIWFVAHARCEYGERTKDRREFKGQILSKKDAVMPERSNSDDRERAIADTCGQGLQRSKRERTLQGEKKISHGTTPERSGNTEWSKNWLEVATELCGVDDGLPIELDGFKLTKAGHRVERLKSLGNAIVPQVAIEIFKAIKVSDEFLG